jgi:hypothetical protein
VHLVFCDCSEEAVEAVRCGDTPLRSYPDPVNGYFALSLHFLGNPGATLACWAAEGPCRGHRSRPCGAPLSIQTFCYNIPIARMLEAPCPAITRWSTGRTSIAARPRVSAHV